MPTRESARKAREGVVLPDPIPGARWIVLTQGKFALVDEADYEIVSQYSWCATNHSHSYARRNLPDKKKQYLQHFLVGGGHRVVHWNGDTLDNRRANLIVADDKFLSGSPAAWKTRAIAAKRRREGVSPPPEVENARWVTLTKGQFALVDSDVFDAVNALNWHALTRKRGGSDTYYAGTNLPDGDGTGPAYQTMHRFLWQLWRLPLTPEIDHKNHNGLDNRRENLRAADSLDNRANQPLSIANTSGYKGVWKRETNHGHVWHAEIHRDGQKFGLGYYLDIETAARAYDLGAIKLFGAFAHTNFPRSDYEDK